MSDAADALMGIFGFKRVESEMKTDRELLELAARAAGIDINPVEIKNVQFVGDDRFIGFSTNISQWPRGWFNPLTIDGDALMLAVNLRIDVCFGSEYVTARGYESIQLLHDELNPCAATRRAIVRAAAAIGESMK